MNERSAKIKAILEREFAPRLLKIRDDSALHQGHAGAREGKGHFSIQIGAGAFDNQSLLKSHQLIYQALGEMLKTDIHALSIEIIRCL